MKKIYEEVFNSKIDYFKDNPKYKTLRTSADDALNHHTGYGAEAIAAADFMDRVIKMPLEYIEKWLNGGNHLEWIDAETGRDYDLINLADALNRQKDGRPIT